MQSLRELYKIGRGPSSSHTIGPERAIKTIKQLFPQADELQVVLYGSLAMTGKGHGTDTVIMKTAEPLKCRVDFDLVTPCTVHPNTMDVKVFERGAQIFVQRVYSVGGGTIVLEGHQAVAIR